MTEDRPKWGQPSTPPPGPAPDQPKPKRSIGQKIALGFGAFVILIALINALGDDGEQTASETTSPAPRITVTETETETEQSDEVAAAPAPTVTVTEVATVTVTEQAAAPPPAPAAPAPAPAPAGTTFTDGQYLVGPELPPGIYRTDGGDFCYVAQLDGLGGETLDNDVGAGPRSFNFATEGTVAEFSGGCTWTRSG